MKNKKHASLELVNKAKLIISKELQSQIMTLHNKIGNIEWSGPLFYSIVSGDIEDIDSFVIKAESMFLCDVGSSAYTNFSPGEDIMDYYDKYPEKSKLKWGLIHTHHSMSAFFSGTDTSELEDNAYSHNYYLSLIVNHNSKFCAKIAFVAKRKIKNSSDEDVLILKGTDGKDLKINLSAEKSKDKEIDTLVTFDCDIEFEQDEFFKERMNTIEKKKSVYSYQNSQPFYMNTNNHYSNYNKSDSQYADFLKDFQKLRDKNDQLSFQWDDMNKKSKDSFSLDIDSNYIKNMSTNEIESFLSKWLSQDILVEDQLVNVISRLDKNVKNVERYLSDIDDIFTLTFNKIYNKDLGYTEISKFAERCISVLKSSLYSKYNLATLIAKDLDMYVDNDSIMERMYE